METTETSLHLRRWREGDQLSLDALLDRHLPWIHARVHRRLSPLLRNKAETVDYVHDALIQFLRFAPSFTIASEAEFRALLLRIAENTLVNKYEWFTTRRREVARERPLSSETVLSLDPPRGSDRTPSQSVERHEREAWIRLGMEFLSPEDREVLVLRKWDNLSFVEIGKRLEASADAVRMKHNRAVRRLGEKVLALRCGKITSIAKETPD
jgi:RNA polymerase sigma-70 factor, ECF subfamily